MNTNIDKRRVNGMPNIRPISDLRNNANDSIHYPEIENERH